MRTESSIIPQIGNALPIPRAALTVALASLSEAIRLGDVDRMEDLEFVLAATDDEHVARQVLL